MNRFIIILSVWFILPILAIPHASASWVLISNGSFESGTVGLVPDKWVMIANNATDPADAPKTATYTHEIQQTDQKYFEGGKSLRLHSRVVDEGLRIGRGSDTFAETEDWINAPSATHIRIYIRDITSAHSLFWGWSNLIFLQINNVDVATTYYGGSYYGGIFAHGESLNFNHYNYTATGADGASWYVYEYSIPESVDKTHMKIQIGSHAWDWTFYDTSYFSDLEFVVDKVELLSLPPPNLNFEEGALCTVPDGWVMRTWDRDGSEPVPGTTYLHDVCENDTHYFSGSRSCWLYSKVIDTDGTKASRGSWTWIESEDWINAAGATYVRFYVRDIQPKHTPGLWWGWNDGMYIGFNDSATDRIYDYFIYNNGETLNFNHYNSTKIGADGATWYEYIYRIPADINTSQMRFRIICIAGDWTFYDPSYFAEMSFFVDDIEFYQPPPPSVSISPSSASICVNDSIGFMSTVSGGTPPYGYQWYLNGNPISGATSSTWTFTSIAAGTYIVYLNVTDSFGGTAKSNDALATVATQLAASISPMSVSIPLGQSVAFTSTVSGGYAPYAYQWYLSGNPVSGAASNIWTFTPTASGIYYVYLKIIDSENNTVQTETARIAAVTIPVGGYSFPFGQGTKADPLAPYLTFVVISATIFIATRRKVVRKKSSPKSFS